MKLSEAVMLGSGTIKLDPETFFLKGFTCGCLIGMGQSAVGAGNTTLEWEVIWPWLRKEITAPPFIAGLPIYHGLYNWIEAGEKNEASAIIGHLAYRVKRGEVTLEQAVDWIRSVEPSSPVSTETEGRDPVCTEPAEMEYRK